MTTTTALVAATAAAVAIALSGPAAAGEPFFVRVGDPPGGQANAFEPMGMSADGLTVVGRGSSSNGLEAFRWTQAGGFTLLGDLPGGQFNSAAVAIAPDGSMIVGSGRTGP